MPWDFWLIFLILGVVIPWRGRVRLRRLLARPALETKEKLALYGSTIAFQWALAGLVAWRAYARGLTSDALGIAQPATSTLLLWGVVGAAVIGGLQWMGLRRAAQIRKTMPDLGRNPVERLLPVTTAEFALYCALAVTAGICEEFLFRGFSMAVLLRAGFAPWLVVLISGVFFGLGHIYQGIPGVTTTTVLGFVLGIARIVWQSLLPVAVWHAAVDLIAGFAGLKYLRENQNKG